ncbi:MAG: AAA family ATPase, partial [Actinomycetota bacterium]|nr:AAA family ATPase [Actinomycetota bacterium]
MSELRRASVLFVDLVAYTPLTEGWDAEDVRDLLTGYFEVANTIVRRYGGMVEKFIGDAVVAAWGSTSSREDDAARCVRAGLEIVEAVAGYGDRRGLTALRARAGVVTGQVASWAGVNEGLVAGDRVNLAARIQSTAEPGSVFVDEVTMRATRSTVAYADAGERVLKGVTEPLRLWHAMRVVAGIGGAPRVDGLEGAFVGRTRELTMVKELFHSTVEDGRARLVAVSGVAGIGKSRLSWEFERYAEGLAGAVFWHRGRCLAYGDGVAFWALAEMVRQRFDIAEDDAAGVAAVKLAEGLPQWVPDAQEREFAEPRLGVLVGAVDRELSREELFAGWRLFFERLSALRPVVLVFEDLHWADTGLFDFVDYLLGWSAGLPIYMLTLARPELAERRPGWLTDRRNATVLHLEPLPDPAIQQLLEELVPGMPEPVKAKITAHAGGIPLYAVETIRSLIDKDLVTPRDGVYCLEGDVEDLDVPASLTAVIAVRLDGLPPAERELVKGLAVLGDTFARRAVAAVSDAPDEQLDEWLRTLVRREFLGVRSDPLSPERDQYMFVQAMLRSVAYDTLTRRERKLRHRAVADHLRAAFPDEGADVAEVIAAHLLEAYTAARTD